MVVDNECVSDKEGCQQDCINTNGSFYCSCFEDYRLNIEGVCEGKVKILRFYITKILGHTVELGYDASHRM